MPSALIARFFPLDSSTYLRQFGFAAIVFAAYLITARIGLNIHPVNTFAALIWPPTGIALVALVLGGYRFWPAVSFAAVIINLSLGAAPLAAFGIALGNTLEAFLGAYILLNYIGFKPSVLRLRDNVGMVGVAVFGAMLAASVGVFSLWASFTLDPAIAQETWRAWWIGDTLGVLVIAPFLIKWLSQPLFERTLLQYIELCAALLAVCGVSFFTFWMPDVHFAYYLFIPLAWAALRTGPRGMTLAIVLTASIAISGTLYGYGPFAQEGLFSLQIFLGTIAAIFLIFTAIVEERRKTQKALERHVEELQYALHKISSEDEAKNEFIAILAHELRNPLAAVLSSVELLKLQGIGAPDTPKLLETIDERIRSMAGLLGDMFDIARISQRKFTLQKETVSLGDLIDRLARAAGMIMRKRGHAFKVTKPEKELYLEADPVRIEQIIMNLLSNAAKYTEPRGSIELLVRPEGEMTVIVVRDSGIGIPRAMLKRIFEPFFQVDRGKRTTEGLGIGLALTRQLVEMHGGTIEAASPGEGRGAEFTVRLPLPAHTLLPMSVDKKTLHGGRKLRASKEALTILVVDDNEAAAEALGRLLELRGHTVTLALSGTEALLKAAQLHPRVVLLDIGLPDIDGYEVARRLRHQKDWSPCLVALTGYGQAEDKEKALKAGFDRHLTKPVGLKEIEAILRKVPH